MRNHFPAFLFHEWEPVGTNVREEPAFDEYGAQIVGVIRPKTDILYRCECGAVKVRIVTGRWTLAQVRNEESAA